MVGASSHHFEVNMVEKTKPSAFRSKVTRSRRDEDRIGESFPFLALSPEGKGLIISITSIMQISGFEVSNSDKVTRT